MNVILFMQNLFAVCIVLTLVQALANSLQTDNVSESEDCTKLSNQILSNMQESADPCQDFYQYACGNWAAKNPLPPGVKRYSQMDANFRGLPKLLLGLLQEPESQNDTKTEKAAKMHFKACMNEKERDSQGLTLLLKILNKNGGWPILSSSDFTPTKSWVEIHDDYIRRTGLGALYSIYVDESTSKSLFPILHLDQFKTISYKSVNGLDEFKVKKYVTINFLTDLAMEFAKANGSTVSREKVYKDAQNVFDFQEELQKIRLETDVWYKVELADVNSQLKQLDPDGPFNVIDTLRRLNLSINETTEIIISEKNYFKELMPLIKKTPIKVLLNYINYHFLERHIIYTTRRMRDILSEMYELPAIERSITCMESPILKKVLSRMYVKRYFNETKRYNAFAAGYLLKIMVEVGLNDTKWMNKETLNLFMSKLNEMDDIIGYKDEYLNDEILNDYYSRYNISNNYLQNTLNYQEVTVKRNLLTLFDSKDWNTTRSRTHKIPIDTTVRYNYRFNKLEIPAAFIKNIVPCDNDSYQIVIPGYGAVFGYFLANLFNEIGWVFDKFGRPMFSHRINITEAHDQRINCFKKQYISYAAKELNDSYFKTNSLFLTEPVHDSFGLKMAYNLFDLVGGPYIWFTKKQDTVPMRNLSKFDEKKKFFLTFANRYCETVNPHELKKLLWRSEKTTSKIRLNIAVSNLPEFSEIFGCPLNSPMNPQKKCSLLN